MAHDREPQAQSTVSARGAAIALAKAIKDIRQELRVNAHASVADGGLDGTVSPCQRYQNSTTLRSKLDRIGNEVPEHLLQTVGIPRHQTLAGIKSSLEFNALALEGRAH